MDVNELFEKLGAEGACAAFVKCHERFEKEKATLPADECPEPITAKEWKDVQAELDMGSEGMECGESELDMEKSEEEVLRE